MQFSIPSLDSEWLTLSDWTVAPEILGRYSNEAFAAGAGYRLTINDWRKDTGDSTGDGQAWVARFHEWKNEQLKRQLIVPVRTRIKINRMHFGQSDDRASIQFIGSDNPFLTPRKHGGKGKGKLILMLTLAEFNSLPEMEAAI